MTSRELVIKTLNHAPVPRVPRDLWFSAREDSTLADAWAEINVRYPNDIVAPEMPPLHGKRSRGKPNKVGSHTDAWGCGWHVSSLGAPPELKMSPLAEAGAMAAYQPPAELLERGRFSTVNKTCRATDRFVLGWSEVRTFDRVRFLRGPEAALVDLARGTKDMHHLLAMLHEHACKELELWANTDVDGVVFRDDWGTPDGLLINPEMWRDVFRPLYRDYCKILHDKDKFAFFLSDGCILDIFGDLTKLGIDAIHAQTHLMDFERLAKRYRDRITFWGGFDSQRLRNPGTHEEFRDAVLSMRKALDFGSGGVIAQCSWDPDVRLQTIAAYFEQWLVPLSMHA